MRRIEFHFDFRSPYSYLALSQLPSLDAEILYRPFDVLSVMDRVGNVPTSVVCRPKGDYVQRDMRRWAKRYGIPFQPNPAMREADMTRLPRAAIAADRIGAADTAVAALFAALWREPAPLATREDIFAILKGAGIDPASLGDIDAPDLARAFEEATDAAAKRGLFGSPTFFVGDEMFFGNDRLDFVSQALEQMH